MMRRILLPSGFSKSYLLGVLLITLSTSCSFHGTAQSLFFDNLENSVWTSETLTDAEFHTKTSIELGLVRDFTKPITSELSIWEFGEDLEIWSYDPERDERIRIASYSYRAEAGNLIIEDKNFIVIKFSVGIVSSGLHASLYRLKQ